MLKRSLHFVLLTAFSLLYDSESEKPKSWVTSGKIAAAYAALSASSFPRISAGNPTHAYVVALVN